ncbi:type II toxin-antitoxin system Phd/YefM family antitoxin [Xylanimonas protaetiae]|uniref:Antitoxin n=1 Tax=Xylanimonas protaetiae TaxID=2509457 RepID=A0A4P6FFJ8_9MICO|nr:type II toxin-antitoxin system prevent-host-death family antitoxin [Xylanimonas protaetiae]QAY69368.1 type II toxin-antitoxin system prevent-host-death family antitoxin [Xylanimonas protaetiae]
MHTASTRELKQNPAAVIKRVLETGDEVEITAHGHPTGVRLVPDAPGGPAPWVQGSVLMEVRPRSRASRADAEDLRALIDAARDEDGDVVDPWERP